MAVFLLWKLLDRSSTLGSARMTPRRLALPPVALADSVARSAQHFVTDVNRIIREALEDRISADDPAFSDGFVQALNRAAAAVRTLLHASDSE